MTTKAVLTSKAGPTTNVDKKTMDTQKLHILAASLKRGFATMASRPLYLGGMVFWPLFLCVLLLTLLQGGLPLHTPTVVVDLDQSPLSRNVTRLLKTQQSTAVTMVADDYDKGLEAVQDGRAYGMFVIPRHFGRDVVNGRVPTIEFFENMSYFVAGTFAYRSYKTTAVAAASQAVAQTAQEAGVNVKTAKPLIQPMAIDTNPVHNPWTNYSMYMSPSFGFGGLALMIILMTIFSITAEIKNGTSRQWLQTAGGSITVALVGKLLPQAAVFIITAMGMLGLMFGPAGFAVHGSLWWIILATVLFVFANQGFAVFLSSVLPNPRLALSAGALLGMLAFSFTGFSFPVEQMYGAVAAFAYTMPVRYWFLIYINQALDGFDVWYVRWCFVALVAFCALGAVLLRRLKRAMLNPVYVP